MPPVLRACIPFSLCVLVACSPSQTPNDAPKPAAAPQPPAATAAPPPAHAVIDPKEEKCTTEPRTDDNDTRPRCGGMGSAQPLPSHAYRIGPVQCPGGGHESITACDVSQPFTATVCGGMATIAHVPTGADGGTWSFKFQGAGGFADSNGTYTLSGPEESRTEHVVGDKICAHAAGRTICTMPKPSTATWTRIDKCKATP